MKNRHNTIFFAFIMFFVIGTLMLAGCTSTSGFFGAVHSVIVGDDYEAAGETLGQAGYYAYCWLKEDGSYPDQVAKCEELYTAIQKTGSQDIGAVNEAAVEVCRIALAAKYGTAKATLITQAIRIGGAIADRIMARRLDTVAASQFTAGFLAGVQKAKGDYTPAEPAADAGKDEFCPTGNCQASALASKNKIKYQRKLAKNLLNYAPEGKIPTDGDVTARDNLTHFIERLDQLKALGHTTTKIRIEAYAIKEKVLVSLRFVCPRSDGTQGWETVDCIQCYDIEFDEE